MQGHTWADSHHLRGTAEYGDPEDDSQPWSVLWTAEEAEEFLLASGNMKYWLVVSREELIGIENDDVVSLPVLASSEDQPSQGKHLDLCPSKSRSVFYLGKMMNRGKTLSIPQDPEVFIRQSSPFQCVYGEGSMQFHNEILKTEGGMNVFIRKK